MKRLLFSWIAATLCAGCGGMQIATAHDPCTLLAASEAEPYVGPLAVPPYRASDGAADARGDQCLYRGKDGREVAVRPTWRGGHVAGQVLQGVPGALGSVLSKADPGFDTLVHRVMQQGPAGPWDQATWIPGGSLFASKGEVEVSIDVSGASGRQEDALALARIIMPRFVHPLAYDGAKAVALAPRPMAHPAAACDLAPRADVEAAIGPLAAAPSSESPPTSCTYRVASADGDHTYPVEFTWQGGQRSYRMLTHGMATVAGLLGTPASTPLDTMHPPAGMGAAIGGLMKMVTGSSGAATTEGVRTDTALTGPWDHAALLHGTLLLAVKGDVFVGINLAAADYDKAKALLGVICARL
ncbi:MAG: hypothetical protein ACM3OA_01790 [Acidobacteriota bacterium]